MDKKNNGPGGIIRRLTPLCITLAATAIVLQNAFAARTAASASDEPLQPLMDWLSPAAIAFLGAGYIVSILMLCYNFPGRKQETQ